MLQPKNGRLAIGGKTMDYTRFGTGPRTLVMIPGVGDGFKTGKGMALPFSLLYRALTRDFTVYVFSRERELAPGTSTRDMAESLNAAMEALGLQDAAVVGISQGGMIAQWLAADHPDKVSRLVLTVTAARPNPTLRGAVGLWLEMAEKRDYRGIMLDTAERSYSPRKLKSARITYGLLSRFSRPASFDRFVIQAEACLGHDAWDVLERIACPTLVIGGGKDGIVTGEASVGMADRIPGSELAMYDSLSHGLYEEAPDFLSRVAAFCQEAPEKD